MFFASQLRRISRKALLNALIVGALCLYQSSELLVAQAQGIPNVRCNDLVYINAKEINNYLEFPGSPFKPMVKITVSYRPIRGDSLGEERLYEDLWYQGPHVLGCRRYRDFDASPKDLLYVYAQSSSTAENAAIANAIIRILLDANLNRDAIVGISVPSESFWPLVDQFETENFYRPGKLAGRPAVYISLPLRSDDGHKVTLVYSEPI